jgi:hypothetical protein
LSISSAGGREETPADEARIAPNSGDIQWLPGQGFEVSFTVTVTGQYATSISLGDSEATHSRSIVLPATLNNDAVGILNVIPAAVLPANSQVRKLSDGSEAVPANLSWHVLALDRFGNHRGNNSDIVTVEISTADGSSCTFSNGRWTESASQ